MTRTLLLSMLLTISIGCMDNACAGVWANLWLRPDQQAMQALQQKQPSQAAKLFQNEAWKGYALYRAKNYWAAAHSFSERHSANSNYNRGNALCA